MPEYSDEVMRLLAEARRIRLNVDAAKVARHLPWFQRWNRGFISTGQLMNRTGVRFRPKVTAVRKVE